VDDAGCRAVPIAVPITGRTRHPFLLRDRGFGEP
jgi:hypothetical protein